MKKQDAISLLEEDGSKLSDLSEDLRKDSEIVMAVESVGEEAIDLIDESLREDEDILNILG